MPLSPSVDLQDLREVHDAEAAELQQRCVVARDDSRDMADRQRVRVDAARAVTPTVYVPSGHAEPSSFLPSHVKFATPAGCCDVIWIVRTTRPSASEIVTVT